MNPSISSVGRWPLGVPGGSVPRGLILYEDDHLLVVNKPSGLNTHAPAAFAGEGLFDWLRHREPRWSNLSILHRLDKETSGVLVFGKSTLANRALAGQFNRQAVEKVYVLRTSCRTVVERFTATSCLARVGERYVSRPMRAGGDRAETHFFLRARGSNGTDLEARPATGRTHQIRVHAAEHGFAVLGDQLYGGMAFPRLCLHSESLSLRHPTTDAPMTFKAEADFSSDPGLALRAAIIDPEQTNAYRLVHAASDRCPGWYVDRLGDVLLSHSEGEPTSAQRSWLESVPDMVGAYHRSLTRRPGVSCVSEMSPRRIVGPEVPGRFVIRENGLNYELSFQDGYSVGLFLDQRDNRRRFLVDHVGRDFPVFESGPAGAEVLNTFAYTCGFSLCAARSGARTTSIDLSKKYLEWGKRNFLLNELDPAQHEFIYGDVFEWVRRLARKKRMFDAIILDPPTFSRSKREGVFRAEKDYSRLVASTIPMLKPGGVLLASTNAAGIPSGEEFVGTVTEAINQCSRRVVRQHYVPQPIDFPLSRDEPAYLKTVWLQVA